MRLTVGNAIKLIEKALKEARRGVFRVRSCRGFEKMIKVLTDLRRMFRASFDEMRLTVRRIL